MTRNRRRKAFGFAVIDILAVLILVFLVSMLDISSKTQIDTTPEKDAQLSVILYWDIKSDSDVDLWVKAPDDLQVGFSRPHGKHFDLVRDDLGRAQDPDSRNLEIQFARNYPAGEYIVNVMMYRTHDKIFPVHAWVEVWRGKQMLAKENVTLTHDGDEQTALRFKLDNDGNLLPDSINHIYQPLFFIGAPPQ